MSTELSAQILNELSTLNTEAQRQVLQFIRSLKPQRSGISGSALRQYVGIISGADAKEMTDAIKSGCEKVDSDEW